MIKPVTYQGVFNFNANLYALEVKSRFIDQSKANGYYKGYGDELAASVSGRSITIGTGAFLVQGRMNEVTLPETVSPQIFDGFVGYVVARIETYHPADAENCTFVAHVNRTYEAITLQQDDVYSASADNINKVYELPIYSFRVDGNQIVDLQKLISEIGEATEVKRVADEANRIAADAVATANHAAELANAAAETVTEQHHAMAEEIEELSGAIAEGQGSIVRRGDKSIAIYKVDNVIETTDTITIIGGGTGAGGEAPSPSPDYDDRLTDLENKLSDLLYEPITVTSFTNSVGTVEMGTVVQSVTLAWKFSKTPVSVTLDGEQVAADSTGTALTGLSITAGKTWTLSATDERDAVATKTTSISFLNGVYTGAGGGDIAILSLSRSLQSGRARTFTATAGAGEYLWYACPTRYGTPTFSVGGFEGGFSKVRTESFTNSSGYTESYDVWRSDNAGLGVTTVVVK